MITITTTLTFQTPFSIGSGAQQGTLAQKGFIKDRRGWPYVPGSTFKGRLRHAVEQIADIASTGDSNVPICQTHRKMCRDSLCTVCQIFGSPWQQSAVFFGCLQLSGPEYARDLHQKSKQPPKTTHRTGVSINRRRRVAEDNRLFDIEILWPGIPLDFTGEIKGDIALDQAALLVAGIHLLTQIGHSKSRGFGWFTADVSVFDNNELIDLEMLHQSLRE